MNFKKFKSLNGDIAVSNTLGHSAVISSEYVSIPESLWGDAYAKGAVPEDVKIRDFNSYVNEQKALQDMNAAEELASIKEKLKWVYENPNGYLKPKGDLDIRKVLIYLKEPVKSEVILKAWNELVSEK